MTKRIESNGCYNCGYGVSVVTKDSIGWLCEWCSDNNLGGIDHKQDQEKAKRLDELIEQYEHDFKLLQIRDDLIKEAQQLIKNNTSAFAILKIAYTRNELQKIRDGDNDWHELSIWKHG